MKRKRNLALARVAVPMVLLGVVVALSASPAFASTLDGTATIENAASTAALSGGASTTQFSVVLPAGASCTGATNGAGYKVWSYLVQSGTDVPDVSFSTGAPYFGPSDGYGLYEASNDDDYADVNTQNAVSPATTGQIETPLPVFEWAPLVTPLGAGLTTAQLLYSGSGTSATGVWEAGIVCANSTGVVTDYWNTEVTFSYSATDTSGFTWTAVPGDPNDATNGNPGNGTPEVPITLALPLAAVAILGGWFWYSRRRQDRKGSLAFESSAT